MLTNNDLRAIRGIVKDSEANVKKEIKSEVKKVVRRLDDMDKFLDKELIADRKRVDRIEEHLGFPQN